MWCTAGFLHAVGQEDPSFTFKKVPVHLDNNGTARITNGTEGLSILTIHQEDPVAYTASMTQALKKTCGSVGKK